MPAAPYCIPDDYNPMDEPALLCTVGDWLGRILREHAAQHLRACYGDLDLLEEADLE